MAGPAQVEFPGGQKRRIRMRGTKKASGSIQKKLRRNLNVLLEEPHSILPDITGPTSRGLIFGDKMKRCLKEIEKVALNQSKHAKVLNTLSIDNTQESAHKLLLKINHWSELVNPYPERNKIYSNEELTIDFSAPSGV